jgi:hypothetical protein
MNYYATEFRCIALPVLWESALSSWIEPLRTFYLNFNYLLMKLKEEHVLPKS